MISAVWTHSNCNRSLCELRKGNDMVFSSYETIFLFMPIVLVGYFGLSKVKNPLFQKLFLIGASLFFYAYFNPIYLLIIVSSIVVNYMLATVILRFEEKTYFTKAALITGILFNIGLLGYFKYYDFFISNINAVFGADFNLKNILLPLGISFFTFQQLSFLISVYKKEEKIENLLNYSLFVVFFPQLVAGPIVLYSEMIPQFADEKNRYFNLENFAKGIFVFSIGLFKKVVIADTVALFVDNGFALSAFSAPAAWAVALSYTLQIYFDFSGYSDMAIGLGKMFNIDIPTNFASPYTSDSLTVFWRKWHMTLGRALSTYVYIPLGGNKKGAFRTYLNLFITFCVSGLWHGAAWTFVIWGALHGIIVALERLFHNILVKIPKSIRVAYTFLTVNFLWVLFRATSFEQALSVYKGMLNFSDLSLSKLQQLTLDGIVQFPSAIAILYVLAILLLLSFVVFFAKNSQQTAAEFKFSKKNLFVTVILFVVSVIHLSRLSTFIYFNF